MHVGKIKYRDQHRAEQARSAQHVQLRVRVSLFCFEFPLGRLRRLGAPPQRELEAKKRDLREKQGAVGGCRVHVGKIKYHDQNRAQRARFAQHVQLVSRFCFEFSLRRLRRLGAPPQRELEAKKTDLREKQGAVDRCRVHVSKIKYRDQHRVERARDQRPSRAQ